MRIVLIILGVIVLLIVVYVLFIIINAKSKQKPDLSNSYIRLFIPLKSSEPFDITQISKSFKDRWGIELAGGATDSLSTGEENQKNYLAGNGIHNFIIRENSKPLEKKFVDVLVLSSEKGFTGNKPIEQYEVEELKSHIAYLEIEYVTGSEDFADRILFSTKLIVAIFENLDAVGIMNVSAQSYITKKDISNLIDQKELELSDAVQVFINTQGIQEKNGLVLHSHGMEQLHLSDIVLIPKTNMDINYNTNILKNAALYNIENRNALKIGDLFDLKGFEESYKVVKVENDPELNNNPFGLIGLTENKNGI